MNQASLLLLSIVASHSSGFCSLLSKWRVPINNV